ncbi:MAG: N-acetyltransferase [Magnetovibrio sp.]|nr:N-acetyltransferase [Magnetovibrio sp.]
MMDGVEIRESRPADRDALEDLYGAAFPDEDLIALLRELLAEADGVFSFVAVRGAALLGHIAFTVCGLAGRREKVGMLAPLAVRPEVQRQGLGGALIGEGLRRLKGEGVTRVQVLGDPAYYGRHGFAPDDDIAPPYDLPPAWRTAWQSISLRDGAPRLAGKLSVPKPWRRPALWAP